MARREEALEPKSPGSIQRPLRVLFVTSHPVQYQAPLFRRLAADPRIESHVVYATLKGAERALDPDFGAEIKWDIPLLDGYEWKEAKNRGSGRESFFGLFNPGVWRIIREGKYDAVVCFVGYVRATFWIALLAAKLSRAAFLFGTDAWSLVPRDRKRWKIAVKKLGWPLLFRLADQVIVPSSGGVELMSSLGIPRERIALTPFVVDNDWWKAQAASVDKEAVRKNWNVPSDAVVVLFCAKLQPWKRPFDVLEAFAKADLPNAVLIFAGDGVLKEALRNRAAELGAEPRVRFLGFANQTQLPAIYAASDVLVLPSEYEPFGLVVNEAFCCGCPAIVSDRVGAGRDLVRPGETGDIFPCGDVEALARSLEKMLALPQRQHLSRWAKAQVDTWSPRENIEGMMHALQLATSRNGAGARKAADENSSGLPGVSK